ncbi:ubiquinol-cytochrome c reductase iron-sulfur subunit [Roseofilum casamattae]|uniref:Rieske (2Fe-2S) protein n=1 Tax=Roseofilum casamattae BLCC-M143 TaxID=3022442 RepID=A0ABT7BR94_9CYAN|nr:Rieske (2Fe-2S) protein [Roseofilum casamattae]MDJ1181713.1 Rieske (2Fe-2S) protein [Roseofilum casamattae BLCC-M143]
MERRYFISWMTLSAIASLLPAGLSACESSDNPPTGDTTKIDTTIREDGFQALGTLGQLKEKGAIIDRRNAPKPVLIFRHPETQVVTALNPMCPHQGCTVEFFADEKIFECPCHSSQFGLDGELLKGPSEKPLLSFPVKQEGDLILVKAQ